MLNKLIYASQAVEPMSASELAELLERARKRNAAAGITGLLLYGEQSFVQLLEGANADLLPIYRSIERDRRHKTLRLLSYEPIAARRFADWSMGFAHVEEDLLRRTLPGYRPASCFPLVDPQLVRDAAIAETLLMLYRSNPTGDA